MAVQSCGSKHFKGRPVRGQRIVNLASSRRGHYPAILAATDSASIIVLETESSTAGRPNESGLTVTHEEFAAVDMEAPIHDTDRVDCWSLSSLYRSAVAKQREKGGNQTAARVYGLLADIADMHFKSSDRSEPYGPQFVMDGKRSVIPSDFTGGQSALFAELVPSIQNPGLRARLADIAWYNNRTLGIVARQAIDAYCESVNLVLVGEARLFDGNKSPSSRDGSNMLRRACQIAHATGWKDPEGSRLKVLIRAVIQNSFEHRNHRGFLSAARIGLEFHIDDAATIAENAETLADSEDLDPRWSHDLWELAAHAHGASGAENKRIRCLISEAECHVKIADSSGGKGMVAASSLMQAIEELRRLPNTGEGIVTLSAVWRHWTNETQKILVSPPSVPPTHHPPRSMAVLSFLPQLSGC